MNETMGSYVDVDITHVFNAPVEKVFKAFSDPKDMAAWMWGASAKNPTAYADLRPGGAFCVYADNQWKTANFSKDRAGMCGVFIEIVPNKKLSYTLHWDADVGYNAPGRLTLDEVVVVQFTALVGAKTEVRFQQLGIPNDGISAREHRKAVLHIFGDLEKQLEEK